MIILFRVTTKSNISQCKLPIVCVYIYIYMKFIYDQGFKILSELILSFHVSSVRQWIKRIYDKRCNSHE